MAVIVPDFLRSGVTQGEKILYNVFSEKLPNNFSVWYEPPTHNALSYFRILAPNFGLLQIQVARFEREEILGADSNSLIIKVKQDRTVHPSRRTRRRSTAELGKQILLQLDRSFLAQLLDKLQAYQILTYANGFHQGQLVFPIGFGLVMSNLTIKQAQDMNIYEQLQPPQVVYRERMLSWTRMSESELVNQIETMFTTKLPFPTLTSEQIETIKGILYPEIAIKHLEVTLNTITDAGSSLANYSIIKTLDYRQECIVKSIGEGHRIVYGVAGSGKTLILLCRAKLLATQNPNQRILIVCFNISLATYLRSLLHEDFENPQFRKIDVFHFYGWARLLCRNLPSRMSGLSMDDCDDIIGDILLEALNKLRQERKWDVVLVDEGQTFYSSWLKCCVAALKDQENGHLIIVADGNQSLYKRRGFTWKSVGIQAVGRTSYKKYHLDKNYRNTQEIIAAAWSVVNHIQNLELTPPGQQANEEELTLPLIQPETACRRGKLPVLHIESTEFQEVEAVIRQIEELSRLDYNPSDIAILYRATGMRHQLLDSLNQRLNILGFDSYWVTQSRESERRYDPNSPGVKIINTLNALGLEFKVVFILWVQDWSFNIPALNETDVMTCRRLYVAMTRAQDLLHVFGSGTSPLLQDLQQNQRFVITS